MANSVFVKECLDAMNKYRVEHDVEPLTYNKAIEAIAQKWADHLASTNKLAHNPNPDYNGTEMGENVAHRWSSDRANITGSQIAEQWYSEIERYDFNSHSGPKTGHFTQVVWKGSKEVGIGRAQASDGGWMVVANFYPAGNYIGENAKHVFPPKSGQIPILSKKNDGHQGDMGFHKSHGGHSRGGTSRETSTRTERSGGVTTTTKTEKETGEDGVKKLTVTETTRGPGPKTKTIVTVTTTQPDGSTSTKTTETEEQGE